MYRDTPSHRDKGSVAGINAMSKNPMLISILECKAALGMEDYSIPSSSIQASSHKDATLEPSNGRIHNSNGGGSWSAAVNDEHQWFQVDFENWTQVSGISTQGRLGYAEWVKTYRVSYSYDGLLYADYKEGPETKVFILTLPLMVLTPD